MPEHYFKIGKLVATFGLQGELVLKHSLGEKTSLKGLKAIFLEEGNDVFLPYFIENTRIKNDRELWVKLEGFSTKEKGHTLTQKEVWLLEEDFQTYAAKSAPISLLGFMMIDAEDGSTLGEILEVIEQPHQVLCRIMINNNDALIPIHEETLDKVDKKGRKVYVTLPDGLLEIYM